MKGMVLAAGLGTRLRPVTYSMPKPMVPLCNQPLIGYAIRALLKEGVDELVINLHHLPEKIEAWVRAEFSDQARLHFSFEPEILGTGGGIRNVRHLLGGSADFFLMNGDTIQDPNLGELAAARRRSDALAALLLRYPPSGDRFTPVYFDGRHVTGFREGKGEALMFAGCHCISSRIFDLLPDRPFSGIAEDVYFPIVSRDEAKVAATVDHGFWFDIGTPLRYQAASDSLRQLIVDGSADIAPGSAVVGSSIVDATARLDGHCSESTVWQGAIIEKGAVVRKSSVWRDTVIGEGTTVADSIIADGVTLPPRSVVENALICRVEKGVAYESSVVVMGELVAVAVEPAHAMTLKTGS